MKVRIQFEADSIDVDITKHAHEYGTHNGSLIGLTYEEVLNEAVDAVRRALQITTEPAVITDSEPTS